MEPTPGLRLCLFGAAPDTGNLGVTALCHSTLAAIARCAPDSDVTVFDLGRGERRDRLRLESGEFPFRRRGGYDTRRFYRAESLWQMRVATWLGGLGDFLNAGTRTLRRSDAAFDSSGGDSFSDIYGLRRFGSVCLSKLTALEAGIPLVLLPQTYGPFRSASAWSAAREIVERAEMAWARDERSFESLVELLGGDLDPSRHRSGVDVAFGLPALPPPSLPEKLERWLAERGRIPVAGLNVSGLIHGKPEARERYRLRVDYERLVAELARRLLAEGARVVLVPHVFGKLECDREAGRRVLEELGPAAGDAVLPLDGSYDASGAKWIISQLDFFCGTRMHSCIAGLSTGVATVGLAYSKKTLGVFETCGQGDAVPDLRSEGNEEIVERVLSAWRQRESRRTALAAAVPAVRERAREQMARILERVSARSPRGGTAGGSR